MVNSDVLLAKAGQLKKHLDRVREDNRITHDEFVKDRRLADALLFNIELAIQNCIDIASHVVSDENLGLAGSNTELFHLLQENGFIDAQTAERMIGAVGFRNVIAHEYVHLDWDTAYKVVTHRYRDLENFAREILRKFNLQAAP